MGRGKKKKSKEQRAVEGAWRPSALVPNQTTADGEPVARKEGAAWYPRPARVVGMCVNVEDKEAELVAIGESGELVDTFKCRWLMTSAPHHHPNPKPAPEPEPGPKPKPLSLNLPFPFALSLSLTLPFTLTLTLTLVLTLSLP